MSGSGSCDDIPGSDPEGEPEAGSEEREMCGVEAGPGEGDGSGGAEGCSKEETEAKIAGGEPGSNKLTDEKCGKESPGLCVL